MAKRVKPATIYICVNRNNGVMYGAFFSKINALKYVSDAPYMMVKEITVEP